jgi:hypothetical protein
MNTTDTAAPLKLSIRQQLRLIVAYEKKVFLRALGDAWHQTVGHKMVALIVLLLAAAGAIALQYAWLGPTVAQENIKLTFTAIIGSLVPLTLWLVFYLIRTPALLENELEQKHDDEIKVLKSERAIALEQLAESTRGLLVNPAKIVVDSYGENPTDGYGVTVGNDGYAAHEVSILKTQIGTIDYHLIFDKKVPAMPFEKREFFKARIEPHKGYGNMLLAQMVEAELAELNIEIVYTKLEYRGGELIWYKTTIALERNESESGGLRPRFVSQKPIPDPFKSGGL